MNAIPAGDIVTVPARVGVAAGRDSITWEMISTRGSEHAASRLRSILAWWFRELANMVPAAVVRALGLAVDVVIVHCQGGRYLLEYRRGLGGESWTSAMLDDISSPQFADELDRLLKGVPLDRVRVEIHLDSSFVFERPVQVPRAAEKELAGILSFELERHTPYRAGEVLFVHRINETDSDPETLMVDLTIVPRKTIDDLTERVRAQGLTPEVVRLAAPDGTEQMSILARDASPESSHTVGTPLRIVIAAAAVLAVMAVTSPLMRLHATAADLRTAVATTRERAATTLALREDISRIRGTTRQIAAAKAVSGSVVTILDTLSKLLPDGTWLRQVSLVGNEVILEGYTQSSSGLVTVLESSPLFESVSYVAPVTREPGKNVENFSFSLKLKGGGK